MSEAATLNFSNEIVEFADKIAGLTLKQAKELSDCLKEKYGIEPAAAGAMMMAGPMMGAGGAAPEPVEQTEFDVVLTGFGDKKLNVVKVVKNITGASLMHFQGRGGEVEGRVGRSWRLDRIEVEHSTVRKHD